MATGFVDNPTVISQFSHPDHMTSICPTPDGCAWIGNHNNMKIKLINKEGKVIQKIKHSSYITDISMDPASGHLLFCCLLDRTIYEVSSSFAPIPRFTTEGYPQSFCMTKEGRIVVGTGGTKGQKLELYTEDGKLVHTTTVEESGTGFARGIAQCGVTGNIVIVSGKLRGGSYRDSNNYRRRIIVYNSTIRDLLSDSDDWKQEKDAPVTFDPISVVYDSKGNMVLADWTRNTIDLISGKGKYIKTLHTSKGQQATIAIQKDDVLWSYSEFAKGKWGCQVLMINTKVSDE